MVGRDRLLGAVARAAIVAVGSEEARPDPPALRAVTATTKLEPTSSDATRYVLSTADVMSEHEFPWQRCHWYS